MVPYDEDQLGECESCGEEKPIKFVCDDCGGEFCKKCVGKARRGTMPRCPACGSDELVDIDEDY